MNLLIVYFVILQDSMKFDLLLPGASKKFIYNKDKYIQPIVKERELELFFLSRISEFSV